MRREKERRPERRQRSTKKKRKIDEKESDKDAEGGEGGGGRGNRSYAICNTMTEKHEGKQRAPVRMTNDGFVYLQQKRYTHAHTIHLRENNPVCMNRWKRMCSYARAPQRYPA